jgi:hypothetical protein
MKPNNHHKQTERGVKSISKIVKLSVLPLFFVHQVMKFGWGLVMGITIPANPPPTH